MNLFTKIFDFNNILPPKPVRLGLLKFFPKARSIEWTKQTDHWEAIFYESKVEKIAKINNDGIIMEHRTNLIVSHTPQSIKSKLNPEYEIMNCIAIQTAGSVQYELIVRDKELNRFLMIMDQTGQVIRNEKV